MLVHEYKELELSPGLVSLGTILLLFLQQLLLMKG